NSTNSITVNYFLKDHLGNTRSIVSETGEVLEEDSYYPFGMLIVDEDLSNSTAEPDNRYKYNGKELTTDFGLDWYEYGFRMYDPQIGRFPSLDPKADEFAFVSPYNYAENSPIAFIDLWGLQAVNYEAAMAIGDPEGYLSYKENQVKAAQSTVNYLTNFGGEKRIAFSFKFTVGPQAGAKGTVGGISLGAEGGENTEVFTLEYEDIEEDSGVDGDCFNLNYISKEDENVVTDFGSFNFGTVGFGASKEEIINLNNGEKEVSETFSGNALIFSGDITKNSDGSETLNKNYIDIGLSIRAIWGVEIKFQVGKQK
ncbi:MAG: RHS repeat-associated core domain-containing protein, partial [Bacteroidales bacterium]|nr:RHS repeat-associated core domain-containing protein [Bacteroidales bacterium]